MMQDYVQEFIWAARSSRYIERLLVEEFKQIINREIQSRLLESECQPQNIEQ